MEAEPKTAKINQRLLQRAIVFVVIIAIVIWGVMWLLSKRGDPDLLSPPANTVGDIAAIRVQPGGGAQAVLFKKDGSIVPAPDYKAGDNDQNVTWRGDGGRLFFESDRYEGQPHLFRWNPDTGVVERRTIDSRAKGFLYFASAGTNGAPTADALMISGGTVIQINADTGESKQILPPAKSSGSTTSEENGRSSAMDVEYAPFGNSFVKAIWSPDRKFVTAIMNRENGGQSLIMQDMSKEDSRPVPLGQAEHIDLAANPVSGQMVACLQGFEIPDWLPEEAKQQFVKKGKIVPPFKHALMLLNPGARPPARVLTGFTSDKVCCGDPSVSPDGTKILLTYGSYANNKYTPTSLDVLIPGEQPQIVMKGEFRRPCWSPDGQQLLALMHNKSTWDPIVFDPSAHAATDLTKGNGSYTEAVFSPMLRH